jgi:hypothetical protein
MGVNWDTFRSDEYLVRKVEQGALSNKHLSVVDLPVTSSNEWYVDTDFNTYEKVRLYADEDLGESK